jgi:hypothetical protein
MKKILNLICLFFGSLFLACTTGCRKEIVFRPVTLRIFDAETKKPLEGISVVVANVTFYPKRQMYLGLIIKQTDIDTHRIYNFKTDSEGTVEIPQFKYTLGVNNFLNIQNIAVNLGVIGMSKREIEKEKIFDAVGFYLKEGEVFYRPLPVYKAAVVSNYPNPLDKSYYQLEESKPYITILFNGHEIPPFTEKEFKSEPTSFFCEHEEFNIYLERFVDIADSESIKNNVMERKLRIEKELRDIFGRLKLESEIQ